MKVFILSLVLFSVNFAHATCAGYANYFNFMCRGKLSMATAKDAGPGVAQVFLNYKHNVRASGASGELLTPGTCSWQERPMTLNEPFMFKTQIYSDQPAMSIMNNMMISCIADSSCVMQMCGTISDAITIHVLNGNLRVTYPEVFVN